MADSDKHEVKDEKSSKPLEAGAEHERHEEATAHSDSDGGMTAVATNHQMSEKNGNAMEKGEGKGDQRPRTDDGRLVLTEADCPEKLGFAWPKWKKWAVLTVIFVVQSSMNMNAAIYANGVKLFAEEFSISEQAARVGQAVFLLCYGLGCELWAPWSEELGRWPILQLSLFLVNIWALMCALAPNYGTIVVGRCLGGLSSAGGSVTLGMVADLWHADRHQYAIAYVVLSSVGGSVIGPLVGPFVATHLSWRWIFWIQLIFGGFTQVLHFFFVPETRETILLDREAKRRRKSGEQEIYGPSEVKKQRFSAKEVITTWVRPFEMFVREPIVLCLSLLSGFSDALIFTFLASFELVYQQWGTTFADDKAAITFVPIALGYIVAWISFFPFFKRQTRIRKRDGPDALQPEVRLYWLLWTAPLEGIGLMIFAWGSLGPPVHWMGTFVGAFLIGIANYCIYQATIDYMVEAYGPYSASATGGNGLARDGLAGIAAMYSVPFYEHFDHLPLVWPTFILSILAFLLCIPIYLFYFYGPEVRARSKFAQVLSADRRAAGGGTGDVGEKAKAGHMEEA